MRQTKVAGGIDPPNSGKPMGGPHSSIDDGPSAQDDRRATQVRVATIAARHVAILCYCSFMSEKPTLALIAQPTVDDIMQLFELIAGRAPTPDELAEARAELAKLADDDDR